MAYLLRFPSNSQHYLIIEVYEPRQEWSHRGIQ